jgi:Tol biopolymer transport system component
MRAAGSYERKVRDFTSTTPRRVLGLVRPSLSPDGRQIAFAAVGDIYLVPVDGTGTPVNLTNDAALDTDPAWSPDGTQLVYSSDRDSEHLQLWIRDMRTGQGRKVTTLATQRRTDGSLETSVRTNWHPSSFPAFRSATATR